jgi:YVTN family beta-propeller protein
LRFAIIFRSVSGSTAAFSFRSRALHLIDVETKLFAAAPDRSFAAAGSIPIAGAAPSSLSFAPDGARLYVGLNMTHETAVIDTATNVVARRVPVGIYP